MDSAPLVARSALASVLVQGRFGSGSGQAGVTVAERRGLWLASVLVRRGAADALDARVREHCGCVLPHTPRVAAGPGLALVWSGPGEWLAVAPAASSAQAYLRLCAAGLASVVEQTGSRTILRVAGPKARDTLAKGLPIDLHPRAFAPGDTALTVAAHVGVQLWQVDDTPVYDVAVPRGYAVSFWRWLVASAAEFGLTVEPAQMALLQDGKFGDF